jgi:sortase (surface protein transpeptidase)
MMLLFLRHFVGKKWLGTERERERERERRDLETKTLSRTHASDSSDLQKSLKKSHKKQKTDQKKYHKRISIPSLKIDSQQTSTSKLDEGLITRLTRQTHLAVTAHESTKSSD